MKGIVFQVLEQCYSDEFGADAWEAVLDAIGSDGAYTSLGNYDDAQLLRIVQAIQQRQGLDMSQALRWFGERTIPHFHALRPAFFDAHADTWSFLLTLNDIIHPEVRKLYPGAEVPDFSYPPSADDQVHLLDYVSRRRMCAFAEGLMLGAAHHYGQTLALRQTTCMHRGDDHCRFELRLAPVSTIT